MLYEGESADRRLAELGLTKDDLTYALKVGDDHAQRYRTEYDPPTTSGLARWAGTVRGLRERLVPAGWDHENPDGLPVTLHRDRSVGVVVVTGDEYTGFHGSEPPTTRHPRGIVTLKAITKNRDQVEEQLMLPLPGLDNDLAEVAHDRSSRALWVLLYYDHQDKIWAELSFPISVREGGRVNRWHERILIPTFTPNG